MGMRGTVLGFDFGTKRIGLAVGQAITATATALAVIRAKAGAPVWLDLDAVLRQWQPVALVVGLPLNMDGTEQPMTKLAKQFAECLHERYQLPVHLFDERLSTYEARQQVFATGGYRALRANALDDKAAQIILTGWLEQQRSLLVRS